MRDFRGGEEQEQQNKLERESTSTERLKKWKE